MEGAGVGLLALVLLVGLVKAHDPPKGTNDDSYALFRNTFASSHTLAAASAELPPSRVHANCCLLL